MGAIPHKAVTSRFLPTGENRTSEAPRVVFSTPQQGKRAWIPLPNDSFKASSSPPVGGRLRSFSRDWQTNICSSNQWPRTAIPLKAQLGQIFSDNIRIQGPPKGPSLGPLHPVSTVKERY